MEEFFGEYCTETLRKEGYEPAGQAVNVAPAKVNFVCSELTDLIISINNGLKFDSCVIYTKRLNGKKIDLIRIENRIYNDETEQEKDLYSCIVPLKRVDN